MSDQPPDLTLIYLRRLDSKMDGLMTDLTELKKRVGLLEGAVSSVSRRLDRVAGDVILIKRRLDLVDTP